MFTPDIIEKQKAVCASHKVHFHSVEPRSVIGIAMNVRMGLMPLNGLRHPPTGGSSGWYIWAGEQLSTDSDFFKPLHAEHMVGWCPKILKFLALPPGWRFLVANEYEDVWFDSALLNIPPEG